MEVRNESNHQVIGTHWLKETQFQGIQVQFNHFGPIILEVNQSTRVKTTIQILIRTIMQSDKHVGTILKDSLKYSHVGTILKDSL